MEAKKDLYAARISRTGIQDLPEECLSEILRRIGSASLPIRTAGSRTATTTVARNDLPVTHHLQCSFVCKLWRSVAAAALRSLSVDMDRFALPKEGQQQPAVALVGRQQRFSNLIALTLTGRCCLRSSTRSFSLLSGLAPRLEILELLCWISSATIRPLVHFLGECRNLRSLTANLCRRRTDAQVTTHTEAELSALLDAVGGLPLLRELWLEYTGPHSAAVWAKLEAMEGVQEIHLETKSVCPSSSAGRLGGIIRSLDWVECPEETPLALGFLTALESLTLRESALTVALPDCLGRLSRLTRLELNRMHSLASLPDAIGALVALRALSLQSCSRVKNLPESLRSLRHLQSLEISSCSKLPESLGELGRSLEQLHVTGRLKALPHESMGQLRRLTSLRLIFCKNLRELPESVGDLASLKHLEVTDCPLQGLPESVTQLTRLRTCRLSITGIRGLPEGVGQGWRSLLSLVLFTNRAMCSLPESVCRLENLRELRIMSCCKLAAVPEGIGGLRNLRQLQLWRCSSLRSVPEGVGGLSNLEVLSIGYCSRYLTALPARMRELTALKLLDLSACMGLERLPEGVEHLPRLERLRCPPAVGTVPRVPSSCSGSDSSYVRRWKNNWFFDELHKERVAESAERYDI